MYDMKKSNRAECSCIRTELYHVCLKLLLINLCIESVYENNPLMLGLASVSSMLSTIYSRVLFCPSLRVQKKPHLYLPLHPLKSFNELVNLVQAGIVIAKHALAFVNCKQCSGKQLVWCNLRNSNADNADKDE